MLPLCPQCSLAFMLPTLLVWRAQLQAVHALEQQQREHSEHAGKAPTAAGAALQGSQYVWLCQPLLQSVDAWGGWVVPLVGAGLAGFVAALLVQLRAGRPDGL